MKVLVVHDMPKGMETWQNPPTVIARLMGLDALPSQPLPTISHKFSAECLTHRSCSTGRTVWTPSTQEHIHTERMVLNRDQHFYSHVDKLAYKDVYEISQKASKTKNIKDDSYYGEGCNECSSTKKTSLARKNKLNYTESQPTPIPDQYRRITVLKPTKACDEESERLLEDRILKEAANTCDMNKFIGSAEIIHPKEECFPHKTKIVILRPSPAKFDDKPIKLHSILYPKHQGSNSFFDELGSDGSIKSRDVAKDAILCMQESPSLTDHARNETSVSSVLSNGYCGDESSFNRSESDYMEEECDIEVMTPSSRLSWDYINRLDSPSSEFSFRDTPFLAESSVITEAKKRLSERWTMVTSSKMNQEHTHEWRNGNTLGEVLSFRETNKECRDEILAPLSIGSFGEHEPNMSSSHYIFNKREEMGNDVRKFPSVQRCNVHVSSSNDNAEMDPRDPGWHVPCLDKPKRGQSSLKGKVSNFFSRNKKSKVKKTSSIHLAGDNVHLGKVESYKCLPHTFGKLLMSSNQTPERDSDQQMTSSLEQYLSCEECGYKEHPCSLSVLQEPNGNKSIKYSDTGSIGCQRTISRSSPIESVARSLLWDREKCSGRTTVNSSKHLHSCISADVQKEERLLFVQSLLSSAGLSTETSDTFLARWHSVDIPLNPALLEEHLMAKDGTRCRGLRSNLKLLFDCINAALLDISLKRASLLSVVGLGISSRNYAPTLVTEDVSRQIDDWFCTADKLFMLSYTNKKSFEVDMVVRKEASMNMWSEMMGLETAAVGVFIEERILDGLIGEVLEDFTSGLLQ